MNLVALATPLVILALVNLGKSMGVTGKWSMLLAVILGVLLAVADGILGTNPVYGFVSTGLILGLTAAGLYDVSVTVGKRYAPGEVPDELENN